MIVALPLLALVVWLTVIRPSRARQRHPPPPTNAAAQRFTRSMPLKMMGPSAVHAVVEMECVSKRYGRRAPALDRLCLTVPAGGVFGLLGQNGAGKTTAMRCMLGLVRPTEGTCRLLGADCSQDLHRVASRVGALIESPGLAPTLSGRRNLALLARLDGIGPDGVERALVDAGLGEQADDPVVTYSLGMRQRLGIAGALLRDPEVIVLDEPANGLDPAGISELRHLLVSLARAGRTVIVSSHLLDEVERICDRVAIIDRGRCVAAGTVSDVLARAGAGNLVVGIDDLAIAKAHLETAGIEATVVDGALHLRVPPEDASKVNRLLTDRGIYLSELRYVRPSLEAVFFSLTLPPSSSPR